MMKKICAVTLIFLSLFTANLVAQDFDTQKSQASARDYLEGFDDYDVATILDLLAQKTEGIDSVDAFEVAPSKNALSNEEFSSAQLASSSSWQVIRVLEVSSADSPSWETISRYTSRTSENHGGSFLMVRTLEKSFRPLYGIVTASAKFRYWSATEMPGTINYSDGIYQIAERTWLVSRNITSGTFKFDASYASSIGVVRLNTDLDIR